MEDLDKDPLDLLDDDGDGVMEMCLFFDEDGKNKGNDSNQPGKSGCCVALLAIGGALSTVTWSITNFMI